MYRIGFIFESRSRQRRALVLPSGRQKKKKNLSFMLSHILQQWIALLILPLVFIFYVPFEQISIIHFVFSSYFSVLQLSSLILLFLLLSFHLILILNPSSHLFSFLRSSLLFYFSSLHSNTFPLFFSFAHFY